LFGSEEGIMKSFLKWTVIGFCALALVPLAAAAAGEEGYSASGGGGFLIGFQWLDLGDLNDELKANGYNSFDRSVVTYGGTGYGIIGERLMLGGEGHGFSQESSTSTYLERLDGGYGMFDVGYIVFSRWGLALFPTVGLGWGGVSLRITERSVPSFDDILTTPARESQLNTSNFMLQGGIGADYRLNLGAVRQRVSEGGASVRPQSRLLPHLRSLQLEHGRHRRV
jgi:hypothetical protein